LPFYAKRLVHNAFEIISIFSFVKQMMCCFRNVFQNLICEAFAVLCKTLVADLCKMVLYNALETISIFSFAQHFAALCKKSFHNVLEVTS
jgi:hypothetical protein